MQRVTLLFLLAFFLTGGIGLAANNIKVTYPDSHCKKWYRDVNYAIKWSKTGIEGKRDVNISLVSGKTRSFVRNIAIHAPNTGLYLWHIPANIPIALYRIRISTPDGRASGYSVAFRIVDKPAPPQIQAISPSSGATLFIGAKCPIRWNSTGIFGNIRISIWQGNSWKGNIYVGRDTHNFQWTVGQLDSKKWLHTGIYKIRIQAIQDYSVYSDIDGVRIRKLILAPIPRKPHRP